MHSRTRQQIPKLQPLLDGFPANAHSGWHSSMKREYPKHPIVGVGGVVIRDSRVLLIRRGTEPLKGEWSIPGGMLELGESLVEGVKREVLEETGLRIRPLEVVAVLDRIQKNAKRVRYHYVIIDYVCRPARGRLKPGSDVLDARWVQRKNLPEYKITPMAAEVIADAFDWTRKHRTPTRKHRSHQTHQ
jgi:8-oxo-dGTP diphosphatase